MLEEFRLGFAFIAGMMTFFAPCAYPLLPGYVAYFLGDEEQESRLRTLYHALVVSVIASLGVIAVYVGLLGVAVTIGTQYLQNMVLLGIAVSLLIVALGFAMVFGIISGRWLSMELPERQRTYRGYAAFGAGYAIAAAGCTAPLFIAVVLSTLDVGVSAALATVFAYTAGLCVLLAVVTVLTAFGRNSMVRRFALGGDRLKTLAGVLLILAGVTQLYLFLFQYGGLHSIGFV